MAIKCTTRRNVNEKYIINHNDIIVITSDTFPTNSFRLRKGHCHVALDKMYAIALTPLSHSQYCSNLVVRVVAEWILSRIFPFLTFDHRRWWWRQDYPPTVDIFMSSALTHSTCVRPSSWAMTVMLKKCNFFEYYRENANKSEGHESTHCSRSEWKMIFF